MIYMKGMGLEAWERPKWAQTMHLVLFGSLVSFFSPPFVLFNAN